MNQPIGSTINNELSYCKHCKLPKHQCQCIIGEWAPGYKPNNIENLSNNKLEETIFIEKKERVRFIIQHKIGFSKILDEIKKTYKVYELEKDNEIIILIEER